MNILVKLIIDSSLFNELFKIDSLRLFKVILIQIWILSHLKLNNKFKITYFGLKSINVSVKFCHYINNPINNC